MPRTRSEIVARLKNETENGRSILTVGAGNGLVARCSADAGADLIVVYNSGMYRLNGLPSIVASLPIGNANEVALDMGKQIGLRAGSVPMIAGVYGPDPTRDKERLLSGVIEVGYEGIINFPTVARIDGNFRKELEAAGLGFKNEVEIVAMARIREIFSCAYVFTAEEAVMMADAGADVIVGHMGRTSGGDVGAKNVLALDAAVQRLNHMFGEIKKVRDDVILLSHGGPIENAEDAEYVNLRTDAVGFVAASSVERIPVEETLKSACAGIKSIRLNPERSAAE